MARMFVDSIRVIYQQPETARDGLVCITEEIPQFMSSLECLVENVCELLASEERLIRTNSPAIIIGDLLGNLDTLMSLEQAFWPSVPVLWNNLIFLGNYCGNAFKYSVEVVCYVLAMKILSPNKVFILRGSNDIRDENKSTLLMECVQRYGEHYGKSIWNCLNEALDRLPVAVVIDESIFAVHSGIPKTKCLLPEMYAIQHVLQNVEKESPLAYEANIKKKIKNIYNIKKIFLNFFINYF